MCLPGYHSRGSGGGEVGEVACAGSRVRGLIWTSAGHFVYPLWHYLETGGGWEGRGSLVEESSSGAVVALGDTRVVIWAETVAGLLVEEVEPGVCCHPGWYTWCIRYCMPRGRCDLHRRGRRALGGRAGLLIESNSRLFAPWRRTRRSRGRKGGKRLPVRKVDLEMSPSLGGIQ